jgi:hypothetical protein
MHRIKHWKTALAIIAALYTSLALADDFKTINGKEYKNAKVSRVEPDGIVLITKSGISKVYFTELPKEVQQRFNYEPEKAAAYSAEQSATYEEIQKQQEKEMRQKAEQAGKQQAAIQQNVDQLRNVQALPPKKSTCRSFFNALQLSASGNISMSPRPPTESSRLTEPSRGTVTPAVMSVDTNGIAIPGA